MPVSYTISDHGCYVEFVAVGHVTGAEIIEQKLAMSRDQLIKPGFLELCDFTAVTGIEAEPDFFEAIARATEVNQDAHRNGRTAIIVSRADFFDMARQFERTVAGFGMTVIVFNHRDTAMLWLGRRVADRGWDVLNDPDRRSNPDERSRPDKGSAPTWTREYQAWEATDPSRDWTGLWGRGGRGESGGRGEGAEPGERGGASERRAYPS
jgi:hypothetical protein